MKYTYVIPVAILTSILSHVLFGSQIVEMFFLLAVAIGLLVYVKPSEWIKQNAANAALIVVLIVIFNVTMGHMVKGFLTSNFPVIAGTLPQAKKGTDLAVGRFIDSPAVEVRTDLNWQKRELGDELAKNIAGKSLEEQQRLINEYQGKINKIDNMVNGLESKNTTSNFKKIKTTAIHSGSITLPPHGSSPWYHGEFGTTVTWSNDGNFKVRYKDGQELAPTAYRNTSMPFQFINLGDSPVTIDFDIKNRRT